MSYHLWFDTGYDMTESLLIKIVYYIRQQVKFLRLFLWHTKYAKEKPLQKWIYSINYDRNKSYVYLQYAITILICRPRFFLLFTLKFYCFSLLFKSWPTNISEIQIHKTSVLSFCSSADLFRRFGPSSKRSLHPYFIHLLQFVLSSLSHFVFVLVQLSFSLGWIPQGSNPLRATCLYLVKFEGRYWYTRWTLTTFSTRKSTRGPLKLQIQVTLYKTSTNTTDARWPSLSATITTTILAAWC